jgi:hypothetical protein
MEKQEVIDLLERIDDCGSDVEGRGYAADDFVDILRGVFDDGFLASILAAGPDRVVVLPEDGERGGISDGYHTFDELYDQRAVLFSTICRLFPDKAWKSKLHSDGTMFEGCFIVGIETPEGQYTYHYGMGKWDWFPVREIENAPEWDGHTDKHVRRLWSLAAAALKGATE